MAYFPNGTAGYGFDEQCSRCRYGDGPCPIWAVQNEFNYKACNNKVARAILDALVKDDGTCAMFQMDPTFFEAGPLPAQKKEAFKKTLDEISGVRA